MIFRSFSGFCALALTFATLTFAAERAVDRPNIVLIISDDHGRDALGCYGNPVVKTPNLDALAAAGTRFTNAFCTTSSCSPSRAVLLSGQQSHRNGMYGLQHDEHHFQSFDRVKSLPVRLAEAGYHTVRIGKYHLAPESVYAFETVLSGGAANDPASIGRSPVEMAEGTRKVIEATDERPFFLYFATDDPHRSNGFTPQGVPTFDTYPRPNPFGNRPAGYPGITPQTFRPEDVIVPAYLPDTPATRAELAEYYQSIARLDQGIGRLVEVLKAAGKYENTLIVYLSDNGEAFPGAKTTLYEPGIRLPFIVKPAGPARAGVVQPAMISWADLTPTLLEAAGVKVDPAQFDGRSFVAGLDGRPLTKFDEVYASHTFHEITMYYPMRMVRTARYKLIHNLAHELTFPASRDLGQSPAWRSVQAADGKTFGRRTIEAYLHRAEFELYDLEKDPDEIVNLAADPAQQGVFAELRGKLAAFQKSTQDPFTKGASYVAPTTAAKPRQTVFMANGAKAGEITHDSAIVWTRLTRNAERNLGGAAFAKVKGQLPPEVENDSKLTSYELNALRVSAPVSAEAQLAGRSLDDMEGAVPGAAGEVRVTYWPESAGMEKAVATERVAVSAATDFIHQFTLRGLQPGTCYEFHAEGFSVGEQAVAVTATGSFMTAPAATAARRVSFVVANCQDYGRRDDPQNGHRIYPLMGALRPDFFVHTGDLEYFDKPTPLATNLPLARFKFNRIFALPFQRAFHSQVANYFMKDDHDTLKDDAWVGQTYGDLTWEQGLALFREQVPMGEKTYRTIRWGRDLQVWLVEGRDFRSPNTDPDGPAKTIWGEEQKKWFFDTVRASDATFRVLISPTPLLGPDRAAKSDNHANETFTHEGDELRAFIAAQKNMVVICGDRHWQYVSQDLKSGLREYSTGPSSDSHAGGFSEADRSEMHRFLRIKGGFLAGEVDHTAAGARLMIRHYGTDGVIYYEDALTVGPAGLISSGDKKL
ncbi:sulfatase-like hydrolase/transferase [Oleiharenicola lentus]|uniref:sulfatase-like hydrolase/transferase n=1 Tax=Oleiharenicola lentus TaxID=2508720 RepID=UPI003F68207B